MLYERTGDELSLDDIEQTVESDPRSHSLLRRRDSRNTRIRQKLLG